MSIKVLLSTKIDEFSKEYSEFRNETDNKKFLFFSIFQILKDMNLDYDDIVSGITDGSDDFGIDAIYLFSSGELIKNDEPINDQIGRDAKIKIQLFQVTRDNGFSETVLLKIQNAVEKIFDMEQPIDDCNSILKDKINLIRDVWKYCFAKSSVKQIDIELIYVSRNLSDKTDKLKQIENKIYSFLKKQQLGYSKIKYFGIPELYEITSESSYEKELIFKDITQYAEPYNENLVGYYGLVRLKDILTFITNDDKEIAEKYFEGNIRDYYGITRKVNNKIKETIANKNKRMNFWCLNNGLTIVCSKANYLGKKLKISNFSIVNGCQTLHVIFDCKENIINDEKSEVLVKVIQTEDNLILNDIIDATNSQTAVSPVSLHSNDLIQKNIEEYFLKKSIYYERRINYYKRRQKPRNKILSMIKLFQIFYSIFLKKPSPARGRTTESFENNYDLVFNTNYDYDSYLLAYGWHNKINSINREYCKKVKGRYQRLMVYAQFHLSRVAFALAINNDSSINLQSKTNIFKNKKNYIVKLLENDSKIKSLHGSSVDLLVDSLKNYNRTSKGSLILSYNLFKSDELDKYINKKLAQKFTRNKN